MGYRDESISETPKLERTVARTDPVRVAGPDDSRGKKLIVFGNLFGLYAIYEGDEVRTEGEVGKQAESSGSVEVTEMNWQDQVDGVSDKWMTGVKKTVRFGGARGIPEEKMDVEGKEENAMVTLSLSVQVPAGDVGTTGNDGWRWKSSMSKLLEKL